MPRPFPFMTTDLQGNSVPAPIVGSFIYALTEPGTLTIRYIGKTNVGRKRFALHYAPYSCESRPSPLSTWVKSLRDKDERFGVVILQEVLTSRPLTFENSQEVNKAERYWIALAKQQGHDLLNRSPGGEGGWGWKVEDPGALKKCPHCQESKPPAFFQKDMASRDGRQSVCGKCRGAEQNKRKYPIKCVECLRHRRLDRNSKCSKCNRKLGLAQCRSCGAMLPVLMSFYPGRAICKLCLKERRLELAEESPVVVTHVPNPQYDLETQLRRLKETKAARSSPPPQAPPPPQPPPPPKDEAPSGGWSWE